MSFTDDMKSAASAIAIDAIGAMAAKIASTIVDHLLGSKADDGSAKRVARAMITSGVDTAALELQNKIAAGTLDARVREVLAQIERDMADVFEPKGTMPQLDLKVVYTCEASHPSWDLFRARVDLATIGAPTESQIAALGAVGVFDGTVICLSDADRRVPLSIARILEAP